VADDAREVAHQALHRLAAGIAVVAQQRGAAVGAGAAWRGRRRRRGGFGAGIHRSDRERGAATPGARPKIRPPPLAWRQRRRGRGPAAPPAPTMSPSATPARLGEEVRTTAALAAPLVAGHFATGLIGFVDNVIAGRHGTSTLAGVAVGTAMFWLVMLVPMGTLMALPPSVSQLDGAGRRAEVGPLFRQALWLALGLGLLLFVLLGLGRHVLEPMGIAVDVRPDAAAFLGGIRWGVPALTVYLCLRYLCDGLHWTLPTMAFGFGGLLVLLPLGYAFTFGAFGLPEGGAGGLGLASAIMMWAQVAGFVLYLARSRRFSA